jgi:hypothetical protein
VRLADPLWNQVEKEASILVLIVKEALEELLEVTLAGHP